MKNLTVFTFLVLCCLKVQSEDMCLQKRQAMDNAVKNCLLVSSPNVYPYKTSQEFNTKFCIPYKGWVKTINEYKSCLKNFQKTVFGIIVHNMRKNGKKFCDDEKTRDSVFNHTACFTPEALPKTQLVLNKLTVAVEFVADRPNIDEMIPGLCCSFQRLITDFEHEYGQICDKQTKRQTGKFLRHLVEANVADALDLMCGNFGSLQDCKTKAATVVEALNIRLDNNSPFYNHTPFTGLLRFIERMDSKVNINDGP